MFRSANSSGFSGLKLTLSAAAALGALWLHGRSVQAAANQAMPAPMAEDKLAHATFAGGCFWCMEPPFEHIAGVQAISGYSGGDEANPAYEDVGSGRTGHAESVDVLYDPAKVSYTTLVETYWRSMNPTDAGGQFADRGRQYRPAIFYRNEEQKRIAEESRDRLIKSKKFDKPLAVEITKFKSFYPAEDYHQNYYKVNPVRYNAYRMGSGRKGFLEKTWGKDYPEAPVTPVSLDNDGIEEKKMGSNKYSKPADAEIKKRLTSEQYQVTQKSGTERAFSGAYWDNHKDGLYVDIVTGEPLFSSKDKFNSGTGWPSFTRPVADNALKKESDYSHGMSRDEVRSAVGDSHLGHVFDDGPAPTGQRFCINSASLRFIPKEDLMKEGYGEFAKLFEGVAKH